MQSGFRRSEQGSDQVVRTQEIHIVSSDSRRQDQKQERHQSQNNSPQFEPMTFSNTPFSVGEDERRKGRRSQVVPAWRYFFCHLPGDGRSCGHADFAVHQSLGQ